MHYDATIRSYFVAIIRLIEQYISVWYCLHYLESERAFPHSTLAHTTLPSITMVVTSQNFVGGVSTVAPPPAVTFQRSFDLSSAGNNSLIYHVYVLIWYLIIYRIKLSLYLNYEGFTSNSLF